MLPTSTRIDDGRASRVLYRAGRSQDRSKHHLRRMGHEAIQGSATRHLDRSSSAGDTSAAESPSDVRCMRTNPVIGLRSCSMEHARWMPHRRFQGRTGHIEGRQGRAWVVKVKDGNMMKTVVARPEHLRPLN